MLTSWMVFFLLLAIVLIFLGLSSTTRDAIARTFRRRGGSLYPPQAGQRTLITGTGEEFALVPYRDTTPTLRSLQQRIMSRRVITVALATLLVLLAIWQFGRLAPQATSEQFVVLVAPFQDSKGTLNQAGRSAAAQLVALLPQASRGRITARLIETPPVTSQAAIQILTEQGADVLIWGELTSGELFNQESLTPVLAYRPNGILAPRVWERYDGRFVHPSIYKLASQPINGQSILPRLLSALVDYSTGQFNSAFEELGLLADNYPSLAPALPRSLRGNILWAYGDYQPAAGEYRRAISDPSNQLLAALLYNNLGAILQDAGDPSATEAFNQAITLLKGQDLGEIRYNIGITFLRSGTPSEAVESLEQARNLLPPSTDLLLMLCEAYQANGDFEQAEQTLSLAQQQIPNDLSVLPPALRDIGENRLVAATSTRQALLDLAKLLDTHGPLLWAIQVSPPLPEDQLETIRDYLEQAVEGSDVVAQDWIRRSAAEDAASQTIDGRIAIAQAQYAQVLQHERKRWQALVETEIARAQGMQRPRGLTAFLASLIGNRSASGQAYQHLEELLTNQPNDAETLIIFGRALLLSGDLAEAGQRFDTAASVAPSRPEPLYGQALVTLPSDRTRAQQLLLKAIELNSSYFPAREKLAEIAQEDRNWPLAIEQQRTLAQLRPTEDNLLQLAEILRLSGPAGYAEAERVLLELARGNNPRALIALSRLYHDSGNPDAAKKILEHARKVAPNDAHIAYELGQLLEANEDVEGAKQQYQAAINASPQHVQAHLALARLFPPNSTTAAEHYRTAFEIGVNDPAILKQIGAVLFSTGEYETASGAYQRAIKDNPNDAELYHGLAQTYMALDRLDDAQVAEQKALELRSNTYAEALVGLGKIALQRGNPQEAIRQFNAALQLNDNLLDAYLGLGQAAAAEGNWSVAQAHFQQAVTRNPTAPEAQLWLGEALVRQNSLNNAIAAYAQALKLKPNYAEAYFGIAQAQMALGQRSEAASNLSNALKLRPNYAEAWLLQGKLYEEQTLDPQAIEAYTRSINANSRLAEPYYRRALLLIRSYRLDEAESDLESAARLQPNFPEAHYWLGRVFFAQRRPKNARDAFRQAVEQRGGNYAEARFYQGLAEELLGQRTEAIESFQTALAQDSSGAWANEAQAALTRLGQP